MESDVVGRAAANGAGAYRQWAGRLGYPMANWDDVCAVDFAVGNVAPINSAFLLAPAPDTAALIAALERLDTFFAARPGGPIQIWSAWPLPSITERGFRGFKVPAMLRPAGGSPPAPPAELAVRPARAAGELAAAGQLINTVFDCAAPDPAALVGAALIGADFEVYVGLLADRVVATATAYVSDGCCGVYAVATAPEVRGRGYGTALSWAATTFRPDLPAVLQASPDGYRVYAAMGYRQYGEFDLWVGPRPAGPGPVRQ